MMAMAYPLSVDEYMTCDQAMYDIFSDGTLMLYPSLSGDGVITLERHDGHGWITTTIAEDNGCWYIMVFATQKVLGEVIVTEAEYVSNGGHNPAWLLQARYVNGEPQPIHYDV